MDTPYIFISYSSRDKNVADAICHLLEENKIACWIAPRDIVPGETWARAIVNAIKGCSAMVLIYSKESNASGQVGNEVDKAFSNGKVIIPFMIDSTPMNEEFAYFGKESLSSIGPVNAQSSGEQRTGHDDKGVKRVG